MIAPDADDKWMHLLDALDGTQRIATKAGGSHVVRRPGRWQSASGTELFMVGSGVLRRLRGEDLQLLAKASVDAAWAPPAIADVDHDGKPEVFQAAWDPRDYLMAFDAAGLREKWRAPIDGGSFDAPAIADIDDDGTLELVVSGLGGLLGILLALGLSMSLANAIDLPFLFDPVVNIVSFVFSAIMGVIFGYYPAHRASKLDPIDALRHE